MCYAIYCNLITEHCPPFVRFCLYPQELILLMNEPTRIRKLQLLSHQFMICKYFLFFNELIWLLYPNRSRVSKIQFLIHVMINGTGFVQIVLNSWKILEMCPAILFFRPGKTRKIYFCQSYNNKWIFFRFGQILFNLARTLAVHHERSFVPVFFGVSIDHLFDNLESGKRNPRLLLLLFWKNVWTEKVMNFGSKNLYKP